MAINDAAGEKAERLAARILECLAEAEALQHHAVAAHLSTALHALPRAMLNALSDERHSKSLH